MQYGTEKTITAPRAPHAKQAPTPTQRKKLAEQRSAAVDNRSWHERRAVEADKRAKSAAEAKRKAGPQGGRARAIEFIKRIFGETPVTHAAVQMVDRDASGRRMPVRNPNKDRSLAGKARIQARRAARR